jgi:hypothetical protein
MVDNNDKHLFKRKDKSGEEKASPKKQKQKAAVKSKAKKTPAKSLKPNKPSKPKETNTKKPEKANTKEKKPKNPNKLKKTSSTGKKIKGSGKEKKPEKAKTIKPKEASDAEKPKNPSSAKKKPEPPVTLGVSGSLDVSVQSPPPGPITPITPRQTTQGPSITIETIADTVDTDPDFAQIPKSLVVEKKEKKPDGAPYHPGNIEDQIGDQLSKQVDEGASNRSNNAVVVGVSLTVTILFVIAGVLFFMYAKRKRDKDKPQSDYYQERKIDTVESMTVQIKSSRCIGKAMIKVCNKLYISQP